MKRSFFLSLLLSLFLFGSSLCAEETVNSFAQLPNEPCMAFTTQSVEAKHIVGIAIRTDNNRAAEEIPLLWNRFFSDQIQAAIPHMRSKEIYALYYDYDGDFTQPYTFLIGCEVSSLDSSLPEGLTSKLLPAASYNVMEIRGTYPDALLQAWKTIWITQLPRAYTCDFELYPADFHPQYNPAFTLYLSQD